MNKLSDEMKSALAYDKASCGDYDCDSVLAGIAATCDYYDAQIDAQAKTMEELWELWQNSYKDEQAANFALMNKNKNLATANAFGYAVSLFLAAGGVIKE